ncbi:MAG: penicillin-binding protein 2 [Lachnospiraceae bacterium]|nr:penicillin-binding protein 2 [Lachnospiraceae bacterium]
MREERELKKEKKIEKKIAKKLNREYSVVVYAFLLLFTALIGYFIYFNIFQSEKVINNSFNKRTESFAKEIIRGNIYDKNKVLLATTKVAADGTETRSYPYGRIFAHVVGYSDKGKTGIESAANFNMLRSNSSIITRINNDLNDKKSMGDSVVTTLDARLQEAAYNALGDHDGAAVVMEVKTGKVLAMVSKPAYDPNAIEASWDLYTKQDSDKGILLNRATQGLYPPGSTFKIFTLLEYIRENQDYENFSYNCKGSITDGNFKLRCYDAQVHGKLDLKSAFAKSCNSTFASLGLAIDNDKLKALCEKALFNSELPLENIPYSKSSFVLTGSATNPQTMMTAIGQGETVVSPMHMCMVASAIANKGELMKPYLVDHIENDAGIEVSANKPEKTATLFEAADCSVLKEYMRAVVTEGTGYKFNGVKYEVAGKTGTAEFSSDKSKSHSWFVGFAPVEDPEIAIAVIAEDSDGTAVPISKSILDVYFAK